MQNQKKRSLKLMTGVVTHHGVSYPVYDNLDVSANHVKRFGRSLVLLAKLNGSERVFLDYLTEVMDHNNKVRHDQRLRDDFRFYMKSVETEFSEQYLKMIFQKLTNTELLLGSEKKGTYYINPLYFVKNSTNREKLIKELFDLKILSPF